MAVSMAGERVLTFRRLENGPHTPTVTGNKLCVCLRPALPRPAGRDHLAKLWKLGFLFLHLAGTVFWRWSSLSLLAGRKVVCKLRVTYSVLTPVLEITCAAVVGDRKEWLTLPNSTSRCQVASPGVEVSTTGKKGREERGTDWCPSRRVQFRSCCNDLFRSLLPFLFSVPQHSPHTPPLHLCSCVLASARAGAAGREISPTTKALGPSSATASASSTAKRAEAEQVAGGRGGPPQLSAGRKQC